LTYFVPTSLSNVYLDVTQKHFVVYYWVLKLLRVPRLWTCDVLTNKRCLLFSTTQNYAQFNQVEWKHENVVVVQWLASTTFNSTAYTLNW